jgi:hypothetical protein
MIDTHLILFEGPPGSGKTTSAQKISAAVNQAGVPCRCFFEWSPDHPIAIGSDFQLGQVIHTSIAREADVLRQWQRFAKLRQGEPGVTVLESRFWQTSVMLMYIAGATVEEVIASNAQVIRALLPLKPVLINFKLDDLDALVERTVQIKNAEWARAGYADTWADHIYDAFAQQQWFRERGLSGPAGMAAMLKEGSGVADQLYARLPFPKIQIRNPQEDWGRAMREIEKFLEV